MESNPSHLSAPAHIRAQFPLTVPSGRRSRERGPGDLDFLSLPTRPPRASCSSQTRDLAAYRAVAAIEIVVLFFEAQDYETALTQLQKARAEFQEADRRISEFRKSHQGELDRHGHTISAA